MAISDWPENERPREKLLHFGASFLSDAELLAIFLRTGTRGTSALDLARTLLIHFKSLRGIFNADLETFCQHNGLGPVKYVQLQAVLELGRRYLEEQLEQKCLFTNPDEVGQFLTAKLRDQPHEIFSALFLDNRHQLIEFKELFHGTTNQASVYPSEVVKMALKLNASAMIIAHNHPSGSSHPSQEDIRITRRLKEALGLVDIRLLDHLIIGDGDVVSLANQGYMD